LLEKKRGLRSGGCEARAAMCGGRERLSAERPWQLAQPTPNADVIAENEGREALTFFAGRGQGVRPGRSGILQDYLRADLKS
jgi:hypothetical protein